MSTRDYIEKDYYKSLGVPKDATAVEIKKAYRKLARQHHPDANTGSTKSEEKFKEISEAYDVLSNEKTRKEYDEARSLFGSGGFRMPGGGGAVAPVARAVSTSTSATCSAMPARVARVLPAVSATFSAASSATTPAHGCDTQQPRRGADVETDVTLDFERRRARFDRRVAHGDPASRARRAAAPARRPARRRGCVRPVAAPASRLAAPADSRSPSRAATAAAAACIVDDPCPVCHGSGRAMSEKTMQVRIPAGVNDGQRIRLKGKGSPGERGGPNGDLIVLVHVRPHELFGRSGDNLTITLPVTFPEAALGSDVKVPTLGGPTVTLKLPPGTTSGRVLRVRGKGVTRRDGSKGDLLVTIDVAVPHKVSGKAKEALEAYRAATAADNPRAHLLGGE